jgi:hypothetical protein
MFQGNLLSNMSTRSINIIIFKNCQLRDSSLTFFASFCFIHTKNGFDIIINACILVQYMNAAALSNMLYQPMSHSLFGSPSPLLYPSLAVLQPTMMPSSMSSMTSQNDRNVPQSATTIKNNLNKTSAAKQFKTMEVRFKSLLLKWFLNLCLFRCVETTLVLMVRYSKTR